MRRSEVHKVIETLRHRFGSVPVRVAVEGVGRGETVGSLGLRISLLCNVTLGGSRGAVSSAGEAVQSVSVQSVSVQSVSQCAVSQSVCSQCAVSQCAVSQCEA